MHSSPKICWYYAGVSTIGAPMKFIPAGPTADLLKYCGLDPEGIAKAVEEFVK